jgi:hypothetical protein
MPKRKTRPCQNEDTTYGCKGRGKIKALAHWSIVFCDKCRGPEERAKNTEKVRAYRERKRAEAEAAKKKASRKKTGRKKAA